jgi:hypothetical protein
VADQLWQEAVDAGMRSGRVQLDWPEVETAPGVFDVGRLRTALERLARDGLTPFVGIYAVDSGGLVLPADLTDETSATGIVDGMSLDDPAIVARYQAMLDRLVPIILEEGGYVFSIANEPEAYIEERPSETTHVMSFFRQAAEHVHSIDSRLAATVTLTGAPIDEELPYHDEVMDVIDVATYNYYCLNLTDRFVLRGPLEETVPADLQALVDASNGKPVLLQELGCPAGWSDRPSVIGTSPEAQAQFFEIALPFIRNHPRIRAAYVFQMVDWSEELTDRFFADPFRDAGLPEPFVESFEEWLETIGFVTFEEGTIRPSWTVFLAELGE